MDPTIKSIPTPTPNPTPNPSPAMVPNMSSAAQPTVQPAQPTAQPVAQPVSPIAQPAAPVAPASPVTYPGVSRPAPTFSSPAIAATDPITQPEPAPAPDPIEEALKAPIKPAGPVPGSIGSAVSMPSSEAPAEKPPVASVDFSDKTMATPEPVQISPQPTSELPKATKKKSNTGLIILCAITGLIVIALIVVFVLQLTAKPTTQTTQTSSPTVVNQDEDEAAASSNNIIATAEHTRAIATDSLPSGATSGKEVITTEYDSMGNLTSVVLTKTITFKTSEEATSAIKTIKQEYMAAYKALGLEEDPFISDYTAESTSAIASHSASATELTAKNCLMFYIPASEDSGKAELANGLIFDYLESIGFEGEIDESGSAGAETEHAHDTVTDIDDESI